MPRFRYRCATPAGELIEGFDEAPDRAALIERLHEQGRLPIRADEAPEEGGATRLLGRLLERGRRLPRRRLALLARGIAAFLRAGLPLDRALEMSRGMAEDAADRERLEALLEAVAGGGQMSEAMARLPRDFPPLAVAMARAGEATGELASALDHLAECLERSERIREHVRSALAYPMIVLAVCGGSIAVLFLFVVPRFRPLFDQAGAELPLSTAAVLAASGLLRDWWWLLAASAALAAWRIRATLSRPAVRGRLDAWILRAPLLGGIAARLETARFARTLATLLRGGVGLIAALSVAREGLGNRAMKEAARVVLESASEGGGVAAPMARAGVFAPVAVSLVRVGEETAKLEEMLLRAAELCEEEGRRSVDRLLGLVGPGVTVLLGLVVAGVIGSILVAVLNVYELAM